MTKEILVRTISGSEIHNYLDDLARLRIEVFREFPYLYDGTLDYETRYLRTYAECQSAMVALAIENEKVVGASTGLPMKYETLEFQSPLKAADYDVEKIFYCAESVLEKSYRGQGIGKRFFQEREKYAAQNGGIDQIVFCAVDRPSDHPLRPPHYTPLDNFWQKLGYKKLSLKAEYPWKDIDQEDETTKSLTYWMKEL